jgi:hypothetical protein
MDQLLVDTNVVSYFVKRDTGASLYLKHLERR